MKILKATPTQTCIPVGTPRWTIDNVTNQSVMKAGSMAEVTRDSMLGFGQRVTDRYFVYGTPTVGGPIPDDAPMGAYIDVTNDPDIYIVSIRSKSFSHKEVVMGPEVFHKFGFKDPNYIEPISQINITYDVLYCCTECAVKWNIIDDKINKVANCPICNTFQAPESYCRNEN